MTRSLLDDLSTNEGGQWRELANQLASELRRYTMVNQHLIEDGQQLCELRVPASLHLSACQALDRLGDMVADESHRKSERAAAKSKAAKTSKAPRPAKQPA